MDEIDQANERAEIETDRHIAAIRADWNQSGL